MSSGIVDSSQHVTINSLITVSNNGDMSQSVDTLARRLSDRAGIIAGEISESEAVASAAPALQNEIDINTVEESDSEIHEKITQLTRQIKESEMEYRELLSGANTEQPFIDESETKERSDNQIQEDSTAAEPTANPTETTPATLAEARPIDSEQAAAPKTSADPSRDPDHAETLREIEDRLNETSEILLQIHSTSSPSNPFESYVHSTTCIQSWMNRNGVSPIVPEGDLSEHSRAIERKISRFISKVTHSSASNTPIVFQPTPSAVEAKPLLPTESPQLIVAPPIETDELPEAPESIHGRNRASQIDYSEPADSMQVERRTERPPASVFGHLERHRALDKNYEVIPKRRNIQKAPVAAAVNPNAAVKPSNEVRKRPVRYVRRLGQRRIVAGATCQACYLDGLDENGEVITSVQVRNVGLGMMRLKRREPVNQGEELEEPRHRGVGLFGGEDENENENENEEESGMEQYYNRELDVSALERELDRQIRQLRHPTPSPV